MGIASPRASAQQRSPSSCSCRSAPWRARRPPADRRAADRRAADRPERPTAVSRTFPGAVLPPDFRDEVVVQGLDQPTAAEQADDGRLFVLEKSRAAARARRPGRPHADRGPRHPAPGAQLLRPRSARLHARPRLRAQPVRLRLLRLRPPPRRRPRPGADLGRPRPTPTTTTAPSRRPSAARPATGWCATRCRATRATDPKVLVEDWCQQFASHSAGALEFDASRLPLRQRRRGRQLRPGRLGPVRGRRPGPVRRPGRPGRPAALRRTCAPPATRPASPAA